MNIANRAKIQHLRAETIRRIEQRMRPGNSSRSGFINHTEMLEEVVAADLNYLRSVGLKPELIAARLFHLMHAHGTTPPPDIGAATSEPDKDPPGSSSTQTQDVAASAGCDKFVIRVDASEDEEDDDFYSAELVEEKYVRHVFAYAGIQTCPFEDDEGNRCDQLCSRDYSIENQTTGEIGYFSELAVHLIRDHYFFEGSVRYRVDPEFVIRLLGFEQPNAGRSFDGRA